MKIRLSSLRKLIREVGEPRSRWPWISHFDSKNDEGMPHPGSWKKPAQTDFSAALASMDPAEVQQLTDRAKSALGHDNEDEMSYDIEDSGGPASEEVQAQMFKIWSDSEMWNHRGLENKYFASSRKRDADAQAKAFEDPETRKLAGMRASRDSAVARGMPWFPDDE
jgi:hypothetical protein